MKGSNPTGISEFQASKAFDKNVKTNHVQALLKPVNQK